MNKKGFIKPRYEILGYDGKELSVETGTHEDILAIDRQSVDHFLSLDFGIWGFRTADGQWIEYDMSQKNFGTTLLKILDVVCCNPGGFFSPADVAALTQIYNLGNPNNLSSRWRSLRLLHKETFRKPHFFLSKRSGGMGVAWNAKRSFIQISRVKPDYKNIHLQDASENTL